MRGIAIVVALAFVACASAYPVEEQQISVQQPESAQQVDAEKDVVVPEATEIVQIVAMPESEGDQSKIQELIDVDAGVPVSIEATRAGRQYYGGFGDFGGSPGYGGYGRYPGYGGYGRYPGYGGYGRYPGYGGYGRYPSYGGYGRYPSYGGIGVGFGGFGGILG